MDKLIRRLKDNLQEIYTLTLITVGFPAVAWLYFDFRAALLTFVAVQATINLLAIRNA